VPMDLVSQGLVSAPPARTLRYRNTDDTIRRMYELIEGPRGELSLELRYAVEGIVRGIRARDRLSQLVAIYNWFDARYTFVNDPRQVELVRDPLAILEDIKQHGRFLGDCDCASTFLGAAPRTIGIPTKLARAGFRRIPPNQLRGRYSHVLVTAPDQFRRKIVLDPVAGQKTGEMLGRVRNWTE